MTNPYPDDEAARSRRFTYANPSPTSDPDGIWTQGWNTRERYITELRRRDPRVQPFVPMTSSQQDAYVTRRYGPDRPKAIGIQQGETAHITREQQAEAHRFLATDYVLDCTALVLVARDAQGNVLDTSLSHINVWVDAKREVGRLIAALPTGSRIDATLLGGPQSDSFYTQIDILQAVAADPRVRRIRYGFDAASTMAVDVATGTILTATPVETTKTLRSISELPVDATFTPTYDTDKIGLLPTSSSGNLFKNLGYRPSVPLFESYRADQGMVRSDTAWQILCDGIRNDRKITERTLRSVAAEMGRYLQTPVEVEIARDAQDHSMFIFRARGVELDRTASTITEPDLPATGTLSVPVTAAAMRR